MRALVTGGSGYFGTLLVDRLRARGDEVSVFDRVDVPDRPREVRYFAGDVRDRRALDRACAGIDVVFHAVAQVPLAKDARQFDEVNVFGTDNTLQAAADAAVRKVVVLSSSAVYGAPRHNPVDEATTPRPAEAYGRAKLAAEDVVRRHVARGLDATIIRPRTILGFGRLGIFQLLFEWVRRGRPVWVLGRGDNRYQFVHAADLADACLLAADHAGPDLFVIGAERFGTMREALERLVAHAGTKSRVRSLPAWPTERAMELTAALGLSPLGAYHSLMYGREMFFDVSHARRVLGWQSRWSNEEMLIDSYDWYVAHRDEILRRRDASPHRSAVSRGVLRLLEYLP